MRSHNAGFAGQLGMVAGIIVAASLLILGWRPLAAWWADDAGNHALFQGRQMEALRWFDTGLRFEPSWEILHEDRGRALMTSDPAAALSEFERAACGPPCAAEEGDALVRLGKPEAAIDRYIEAKAISRIADTALQLAAQGKYAAGAALERAVIRRLQDNFLERADLASAYAVLGRIEGAAVAVTRNSSDARAHERESIRALSAASDLAPLNEGYLLSYAFAQMQWGDLNSARRAFVRLLQLHPHQHDAEAALARLDKASSSNTTRP